MNRRIRIGILILLLAGLPLAFAAAADTSALPSNAVWTSLLQKHVQVFDHGHASRVDYAGMRSDHMRLDSYTQSLSAVTSAQFKSWNSDDRKAFLVNAYNAFTVQLILTRWPKLDSIKDLGGLITSPWKKDFFKLLGEQTDLDHVETLLRSGEGFHDPRIHFAINCASISCPMLRTDAYVGDRLGEQLDDAEKNFLADRSRNRYDKSKNALEVSKIFDWYADDFNAGGGSVKKLLASHADLLSDDPAVQQRIAQQKVEVDFLPYNWKLNGASSGAAQ